MSKSAIIAAIGILILLELITLLVFRISRARYVAITHRLLAGRDPELLEKSTQEEIENQAHIEHHNTIYRKLDLICIAFQLPGLASWGILTGRNTTPPLYCI